MVVSGNYVFWVLCDWVALLLWSFDAIQENIYIYIYFTVDVVSLMGCERRDSGGGEGVAGNLKWVAITSEYRVDGLNHNSWMFGSRHWVGSVAPSALPTPWLCRRLAACQGFSPSSVNKLPAIMEVLSP